MSEVQTVPSNLPTGISGYVLSNVFPTRAEAFALANVRLEKATLDLLRVHKTPEDMRLLFTAVGADALSTTLSPLEDKDWLTDKHWLGADPAIYGHNGDKKYHIGVNAAYHHPGGGILVDTGVFELRSPTAEMPTPSIVVQGIARYFTDPYPTGFSPSADIVGATNRLARTLQDFAQSGSNELGSWEWALNTSASSDAVVQMRGKPTVV